MSKVKDQQHTPPHHEETLIDEVIDVEELQGKSEKFIHDNQRTVSIAVGALLLVAAIYFYFTRVYLPKQETAAQNDMFMAQQYFAKDSFQLALNGDGNSPGFLDIIDDYSGYTKAANLAHYYAGISSLQLKDFDGAIDHLRGFKGKDKIVGAMALGATGDAYAEKGDMSEAVSYYRKAASYNANEFTTPMFLMKAAMALESQKNYKEALNIYENLRDKYPTTTQGKDADKYISRVSAML
ncbi:MAG: tetratricopeptide repeat protein [Sphingobacteriales bacterium]|nr:tetratricopeptide repeat protein [Sphingobacteriales bacterium]